MAVPAPGAEPGLSRAQAQVLLVDDAEDIRTVVSAVLARAQLDVVTASSGRECLRRVFEDRPDLVILDLGLPDLDGLDVISRLRDMTEVPVLVLSARTLEEDKVMGLDLGADDYVTKPFTNAELVARVQALLRRARPSPAPAVDGVDVIEDGPLKVDLRAKTVQLGTERIALAPIEWKLLVALMRHKGETLSARELLARAWDDPVGVSPEKVKFAVLRLRRRMGWQASEESPIEAVRGFGYRYQGLSSSR